MQSFVEMIYIIAGRILIIMITIEIVIAVINEKSGEQDI